LQPDLKLDDTVPFRLSRNHFTIEKRDGSYYVRDLRSTLGTIVNGEPIGDHFRGDDAPLRAGENEVIAGGISMLAATRCPMEDDVEADRQIALPRCHYQLFQVVLSEGPAAL
jgi:pSer/pThr/pTyr-binding forkhead associated (FHA) protein